MKNSENWSLIARYLTESISAEEEQILMDWARRDPANQSMLDEATKIWNVSGLKLELPEIETRLEWIALVKRIEESNAPKFNNRARLFNYLKVAAVLLIFTSVYFFLREDPKEGTNIPSPDSPTHRMSLLTTTDSVKYYYLPDSSLVWMNIHSKISFDSGLFQREIELSGESFFQIRPDQGGRPFIIHAGQTQTKVLGTAFNIKAREQSPTEVTVVSGKVEFESRANPGAGKLTLGPDQLGTYNPQDGSVVEKQNTNRGFLDWQKSNNSVYEKERNKPRRFLQNTFTYKKNKINQTVIEGKITNVAALASYHKIRVRITSTNAKGKKSEQYIEVSTNKPLLPGQSIDYRQTLLDILSKKPTVVTLIDGAEVVN